MLNCLGGVRELTSGSKARVVVEKRAQSQGFGTLGRGPKPKAGHSGLEIQPKALTSRGARFARPRKVGRAQNNQDSQTTK